MRISKKLLWGGFGWALGGPLGGIIGYTLASMSDNKSYRSYSYQSRSRMPNTKPGDFILSLLVLLAAVLKADKKLLKSELDYVKKFLTNQFSSQQVQEFMTLFKEILEQDYPLRDVCRQIQRSMDHPSRLELIHVLFGLSKADGQIHPLEIEVINKISNYLNINEKDYASIKAMFIGDVNGSYTVLEIHPKVTDKDVKIAYRKMATKYHPDKVAHLGEELKLLADKKFKSVNKAYQTIKKERGIN